MVTCSASPSMVRATAAVASPSPVQALARPHMPATPSPLALSVPLRIVQHPYHHQASVKPGARRGAALAPSLTAKGNMLPAPSHVDTRHGKTYFHLTVGFTRL